MAVFPVLSLVTVHEWKKRGQQRIKGNRKAEMVIGNHLNVAL